MSTYVSKHAKEHGLRIVDARKPLVVNLSKTDITHATQSNSKECAFARACKKQRGVTGAYLFRTAAYVEYKDRVVRYLLPPSVQKEIVSFDRAKIMASGTYQLSPPLKGERLTAIKERSKKRPGRHKPGNSGIKRKVIHKTQLIRTLKEP